MLARLAVVLTLNVTFSLGMLAGALVGPGLGGVLLFGVGPSLAVTPRYYHIAEMTLILIGKYFIMSVSDMA